MRKEIYRLEAPTLFRFMHCYITRLEQMGKNRTAEHYQSALNSFRRFRQERDLFFHEITSELMQQYETILAEALCDFCDKHMEEEKKKELAFLKKATAFFAKEID